MTSGGSGDEKVSCTLRVESRKLTLVAGTTTSKDFGPSKEEYGFIYAIDDDGNWRWGKYFELVAKPVSSITGCYLFSDTTAVFMGTAFWNSTKVPVVLEVSPYYGTILKFTYVKNS